MPDLDGWWTQLDFPSGHDDPKALDVELAEIRDFLASYASFDRLPPGVLDSLRSKLSIDYHRLGTVVLGAGAPPTELLVVRSGAVEFRDADSNLLERAGAGTCIGGGAMATDVTQPISVATIEDTLFLACLADLFHDLRRRHVATPDEAASLGERPFLTVDMDVLGQHRSDVLVTKDSGGTYTWPKMQAAAELDIPVVVVERPELTHRAQVVHAVGPALDWVLSHTSNSASVHPVVVYGNSVQNRSGPRHCE